jgi:Cu-Zn family superoxide dismutase
MKKLILPLSMALLILTTSCKEEKKDTDMTSEETEMMSEESNSDMDSMDDEEMSVAKSMTIDLNSKSGSNVSGTVTFTEDGNDDVQMVAKISGLKPGVHAIHIHESADCSSDDGKSSGGHWNPTGQPHGKWGTEDGAFHKGDIGNFVADENGEGTVNFHTELWCIGCEDDTKNIVGKAIIVHEGKDDLTSQPSGDAGKRVSCAGIIQ